MSYVNDKLKDKYEMIYIDSARYGYSDDTSKKQTVEQMVSDYRNVLKNIGIEGIIFIDGTEVGLDTVTKMLSDERIMESIEENIKWENEKLLPYINLLGNTKIIELPGDHYIFEQKPGELSNIMIEFIEKID